MHVLGLGGYYLVISKIASLDPFSHQDISVSLLALYYYHPLLCLKGEMENLSCDHHSLMSVKHEEDPYFLVATSH